MKVNFLWRVHEWFETYSDPDPREFDNVEIKDIENLWIDEIWYWYHSWFYEWSGQILMKKWELYDIHCAWHCSCYWPTEHIEFNGKQLEDLAKSLSKEYMEREARELFAMAWYTF